MLNCSYPFTRILIPYDCSAAVQRGLVWAAHLARIEGGSFERLTLMRVIGSGPAPSERGLAGYPYGSGGYLATASAATER